VLTHLPGDGDVIKRGGSVYSVDEQKVPLLYGAIPLYRLLKTGTEGEDVAMLEKNLAALGYTGFTVDDTYDSATAAVVKQWQHDLGRTESGTVQPGDAVVAPGARRVADVKATLGGALAGELLTWTGTARMVEVDLDTQYEDLVKDGTKASVKLPDGTTVGAEVSRVGTAATAASSPAGGNSGSGTGDATLPVDLTVKDQSRLGRYQAAPVEVTLTAETHEDVLAVPVNALIARPGGGYAVQAVTASGVEDRAVEVGLFADGLVEVSGAGITAGVKVGIPQ
jgi:peptidoglycan hydrolase-like protein with peptidoglycan-binding domain